MDKNQIITICITAFVSIIAKELVMWVWGMVKAGVSKVNARIKYHLIFNRPNLEVLVSLAGLPMWAFFAYLLLWNDDPLTGKRMLLSLVVLFFLFVSIPVLLSDLGKASENIKRLRTEGLKSPTDKSAA